MNKDKKVNIKYIGIAIFVIGIVIVIISLLIFSNLISPKKVEKKYEKKVEEKVTNEDQEDSGEESNDEIAPDFLPYYSEILNKSNYFDMYLSNKYPITDFNALPSQDKTTFLLNVVCNIENPIVTAQQLKEEMSKHFLPFDLYTGDIQGANGNILYKYANDTYQYNFSEGNPYEVYTEELSNEVSSDRWILKKKIYYVKGESKDNKLKLSVYTNPNSEEAIYSYNSSSNISITSLTNEKYEKIKDQLTTVTYTYKNNGNTYVLESITTN